MSDSSRSKDHRLKKLIGWKAIEKTSGWSRTRLQYFEKCGLPIQRRQRGGTFRVWIYQKDLESFFESKTPSLQKSNNPVLWVSALVTLVLIIANSWLLFDRSFYVSLSQEEYAGIEFQINSLDIAYQLDLITNKGNKIPVWSFDNSKDSSFSNQFKKDSLELHEFVKFFPADYEYPATLTQSINPDCPHIFQYGLERTLDVSMIKVTLANNKKINDFKIDRKISKIDNHFFTGWLTGVNAIYDHLGILYLFDSNFERISQVYYPGHIRDYLMFNNTIATAAVLNARESVKESYRNSLFFLPLGQMLSYEKTQVQAFSPKTIPSNSRRMEYFVEGIKTIIPEAYYAGIPGGSNSFLAYSYWGSKEELEWRTLFGVYPKTINRLFPHMIRFDKNFLVSKAWVVDYDLLKNEDNSKYFQQFKYQKWEKDTWGPWKGVVSE